MGATASDPIVGQTIAHYKIEDKLGQGGMGAVYRASDLNLRRPVALKLLTNTRERSGPARARFLMEARSAAALNHPNIVTIYEVGQSTGLDYIAMELVEGTTLRSVIGRQPMPLERVLDFGAQIADAVAAAHAAGLTHRDLKPANIMVTPKGRLKVLDFGIAKRTSSGEVDHTLTADPGLTLPGAPVGTPNYMSPEQAEGKAVDGRSDIFALGAILYEMLTGRRAFPGDSYAAVMASILKTDPPPVATIRPLPAELDRLVQRCLRKDLDRRFQHAGDLKIALEEMKGETLATLPVRTASPTTLDPDTPTLLPASGTPTSAGHTLHTMLAQPAQRNWMLVVAALAAALGAGGVYWYLNRPQAPNPLAETDLYRVTADAGLAQNPALSRDGKFIAYASDRGQDNLQIWVQQISGGTPIQLTNGAWDNSDPQFSPDGSQILFRSERDGGGLYLAPALGGEARVVAKVANFGRFSPDGRSIAYSTGRAGGDSRLFVLDMKGAAPPRPIQPKFSSARRPLWSPDGKRLLFLGAPNASVQADASPDWDWWIANADGSGDAVSTRAYRALLKRKFFPGEPSAWLSGDRILLTAERQTSNSLWLMNLPKNGQIIDDPVRLTFGTTIDQHPALSADPAGGEQVAFSSVEKNLDIWILPIDANRGVVTGPMRKLTEGAGSRSSQLSMSADGRRIAFYSNRDGRMVPWIWDFTTGKQSSLSVPASVWTPQISQDGRALAWCLIEETQMKKVFRAPIGADLEIGLPENICDDCGPPVSWSPDNRLLVYAHANPSRSAILETGTSRRYDLLVHPKMAVWGGRFSPDGRWLTFSTTPPQGNSQIFVAPFDPNRRAPIPPEEWIPVTDGAAWDDKTRWSPDGNAIYFISERDGFRCVFRQPLNPATKRPSGPVQAVVHLHQARRSMSNELIGRLAFQVSPDRLIFSLAEVTGNIWLLKKPD